MSKPADYRILVVDDEPRIVNFVAMNLELEGYTVLRAYSGPEALRSITENMPDLVLLDIMMPKLSGYSVAWVFRNDPRYKGIPVIFMTAHAAGANDRRLGNADAALLKPFPFEKLSQIVAEHLPEALMDLGLPVPEGVALEEQRLVPREPVMVAATLRSGDDAAPAVILSLSLRGAYVECDADVSQGDRAILAFEHGGAAFRGGCEILYTALREGRRGVGILFGELLPNDELVIAAVLGEARRAGRA